MQPFTFSRLLVLVALVIAVLAAVHIGAPIELLPLSFAVYLGSLLVP